MHIVGDNPPSRSAQRVICALARVFVRLFPKDKSALSDPVWHVWCWVWAIVLPPLFLAIDPVLFQREVGRHGTYPKEGWIATYVFWALTSCGLLASLFSRARRPWLNALCIAPLALGSLGAFAIGLLLLPYTLMGLVVFIGLLGLTPFLTSCIFYKHLRWTWPQRGQRARAVAVAIPLATLIVAAPWVAADFHRFRKEARKRNGHDAATRYVAPETVRRLLEAEHPGYPKRAWRDGDVSVTLDDESTVVGRRWETGEEIFQLHLGEVVDTQTQSGDCFRWSGGSVYRLGRFDVTAYDPVRGARLWKRPHGIEIEPWGYRGLILSGSYLVINGGDAIAAFDRTDLRPIWNRPFECISGIGSMSGDVLAVVRQGRKDFLVRLRLDSGNEIWRRNAPVSLSPLALFWPAADRTFVGLSVEFSDGYPICIIEVLPDSRWRVIEREIDYAAIEPRPGGRFLIASEDMGQSKRVRWYDLHPDVPTLGDYLRSRLGAGR